MPALPMESNTINEQCDISLAEFLRQQLMASKMENMPKMDK